MFIYTAFYTSLPLHRLTGGTVLVRVERHILLLGERAHSSSAVEFDTPAARTNPLKDAFLCTSTSHASP